MKSYIVLLLLSMFCSCILSDYSVSVSVPSYPTIPEAPLDIALLNRLAEEYLDCNDNPNSAEFVFVYLPIWAFEQVNDLEESCVNITEILGILYFSGYFGGQWLRQRLASRPPAINPVFITQTVRTNVDSGLAAASGNNPLSYTTSQANSTVDSFGYNSGYLRTILDHPPTGVPHNHHWEFDYDPNDALDASFETPQLSDALDDYNQWFKLLNKKRIYENLKDTYIGIQSTAYNRGVLTWTTALSVQGFNEGDYDRLLEASSGFLEIARLNALAVTQSVGLQNQQLSKSASNMNTAYVDFTGSYSVGLLNGANDNSSSFPFPCLVVSYC